MFFLCPPSPVFRDKRIVARSWKTMMQTGLVVRGLADCCFGRMMVGPGRQGSAHKRNTRTHKHTNRSSRKHSQAKNVVLEPGFPLCGRWFCWFLLRQNVGWVQAGGSRHDRKTNRSTRKCSLEKKTYCPPRAWLFKCGIDIGCNSNRCSDNCHLADASCRTVKESCCMVH